MGTEYPPAKDMFVDASRTFVGANPRGAIVIHKTAGFERAEDCAAYFATDPAETSSHFIIGLDGTVVQCVSLSNGAAANCCLIGSYDGYWNQYGGVNLNLVTISIEHIDPALDNSTPCPPAQLEASYALCNWLRVNYDMETPDVKTHASIDPVNRARCPGNYDMDALIKAMTPEGGTVTPPVVKTPSEPQLKAFKTQWVAVVKGLNVNTGIFDAWCQKKLNGFNLNAPTSAEYPNNDWSDDPIVCQEGGNWWCQYYKGQATFYTL